MISPHLSLSLPVLVGNKKNRTFHPSVLQTAPPSFLPSLGEVTIKFITPPPTVPDLPGSFFFFFFSDNTYRGTSPADITIPSSL